MTTAEWEVMRVIWTKPHATAHDIHQALGETFEWSLSTVKTLLARLVKKGYLSQEKQSREFHYFAKIDEQTVVCEKYKDLLTHVCSKEKGTLLLELLQETVITQQQAESIIEWLQLHKQHMPQRITCTCLKGQCRCCEHKKIDADFK